MSIFFLVLGHDIVATAVNVDSFHTNIGKLELLSESTFSFLVPLPSEVIILRSQNNHLNRQHE